MTFEANKHIYLGYIQGARGRPIGVEDFPDMTREGREIWFRQRAREAVERGNEEDRFAVLEILEKHLSKAAAARFVKSEEGRAFLGALSGQDREYARLVLEELPGCKRLARELLSEGEHPEEE